MENLWRRWWQLIRTNPGTESVGEDLARREFHRLVDSYASAGRHYHTLDHVQQVLATIATLPAHAAHPDIVELAAWFHDVVYDPQAQNNEAQSAQYAAAALTRMGYAGTTIAPVQQLIIATQLHPANATDPDVQVLLDADLAILGSPPAQYHRYAQAIRQEYAWVAEAAYCQGRSRVLQHFLAREALYYTPLMRAIAEPQARINLQTELRTLIPPSD